MLEAAPCVLIIDPDQQASAALASAAQNAGLRAICCKHWWEARPLLDGPGAIDLMMVELVLPEKTPNGLSAALMARARRPGLPVVFMSARAELLKEVPAGTGAILSKNVGVDRLVRCAIELLDNGSRRPRTPVAESFRPPRQNLNPVARYRLDRSARFRSVNDGALLLWRKNREDLLGRPLLEVFPQLDGQPKFHTLIEVLSGRPPYSGVMNSAILHKPIDLSIAPDRVGLRVDFSLAA
jgi:DNA-binding response OmpR family regulator